MKNTIAIFCLISLSFFSCNKDSKLIADKDFIEISLDGETYKTEWEKGSLLFNAGDQLGCGSMPYMITTLSDIVTSKLEFCTDIKYYQNNEDFKDSKPGNYQITNGVDYPSSCNLCLEVCFIDKSQENDFTRIQPGGIHTVTKIQEYESSNTEVYYVIHGEFTCSFLNSVNEIISLTGKYQITISTLL